MFVQKRPKSKIGGALNILELIYHNTVRELRKSHGNALVGLLMSMMQTITLVLVFYFMFSILGLRAAKIRGDFMLYLMSGIIMYMTQIKAIGAVAGAPGPTSAMMQHAPMNTAIAIAASALAALYTQVLSIFLMLFIYHVWFGPIHIEDPVGAFAMLLLSWFTGCAIGMVFLALKPWIPTPVGIIQTIYTRANMIASGKMFVANSLPASKLALFSWNPLFHLIDQARGYSFINYNPHYSNWHYPLAVGMVLLVIGMMGEFFTRKHMSLSWTAGK